MSKQKKSKRRTAGAVCMCIGALFMTMAVCLLCFNIYDSARAERLLDGLTPRLEKIIDSKGSKKPYLDGNEYIGVLSIPDLDLKLPVMADCDYTRLRIAPCLYYGSPDSEHMVIAAHNYPSHFGRLSQLEMGDRVSFTDIDGAVYNYRVGDIETLPANAAEDMIHSDWALSLYTCTYSGMSRVTVRCEPAE